MEGRECFRGPGTRILQGTRPPGVLSLRMQPPYQAHTVKIYLQLHPNAQEAEAGETGRRAHRPVASRGGFHTPASQVSLGPNHRSRALQPVPGSKERASEKSASWGAVLSGLHHLCSCCSELSGKQLYLLCTGPKPNSEGWLDLHPVRGHPSTRHWKARGLGLAFPVPLKARGAWTLSQIGSQRTR